jgi:hypothetical protein
MRQPPSIKIKDCEKLINRDNKFLLETAFASLWVASALSAACSFEANLMEWGYIAFGETSKFHAYHRLDSVKRLSPTIMHLLVYDRFLNNVVTILGLSIGIASLIASRQMVAIPTVALFLRHL